ncbi:hypothetical protein HMPREF1582_01102 [Gardnerella vaginalis JCP8151A]|nr:hypothetical protein HMPREF1582_01102 [Gardnerella vaginalis JCP8151A]
MRYLCSAFVSKNAEIQYNRTTVLFVCVVRLYQKTRKFGTIALHKSVMCALVDRVSTVKKSV